MVKEVKSLGRDSTFTYCDVTKKEQVTNMVDTVVDRYGRLDIGVNNAGITRRVRDEGISKEDWDAVIDVNLTGVFLCCQAEGRVILSRDTQIMKRRVITSGQLKAVLIHSDEPQLQIRQVIDTLGLDCRFRPFTLCLECNQPLVEMNKEEVEELVPPYVFQTQSQFMQCPACQRIYWRGTHWRAMTNRLDKFRRS